MLQIDPSSIRITFPPMVVCRIFSIFVRFYNATLRSLYWFRVGGNGSRFYLWWQFVSESFSFSYKARYKPLASIIKSSFQFCSQMVVLTWQNHYRITKIHGQYFVLIHDSYPNWRWFHSLLGLEYLSPWLMVLECSLALQPGMPDLVVVSVRELTPL